MAGGILAKASSFLGFTKAEEGSATSGPYTLPVTGGVLSPEAGQYMNWWQMGYDPQSGSSSSMARACIASYAETVAQCPGNQWRWNAKDGRERVTASPLVRILKRPNDYMSVSDFLMNLVFELFEDGNAYALILRNNRFEPQEIHLMRSRLCSARIAVTGDIFYALGGNPIVEARLGEHIVAPARDVLHLRLHTPRHPLIGETPLVAAGMEMAVGNAALAQQVNFFANQSRPSFVLTTDQILTKEQVAMLRESWNAQAAGLNRGGTPILAAGLKVDKLSTIARDSELSAMLGLSDEAIARIFRTPMQLFGGKNSGTYATHEALMMSWRAGGLGFLLNHIEEAVGNVFKLGGQPDEYLEFDTSALMRSAFKDRVEGWAAGVKGGIFDRNAARAEFEMAPVEFGDEPWVQQQDIPLSVAGKLANEPPKPVTAPAAPALPAPSEPDGTAEQEEDPEVARAMMALLQKDLREALRAD